jgi:hypothetical protein
MYSDSAYACNVANGAGGTGAAVASGKVGRAVPTRPACNFYSLFRTPGPPSTGSAVPPRSLRNTLGKYSTAELSIFQYFNLQGRYT